MTVSLSTPARRPARRRTTCRSTWPSVRRASGGAHRSVRWRTERRRRALVWSHTRRPSEARKMKGRPPDMFRPPPTAAPSFAQRRVTGGVGVGRVVGFLRRRVLALRPFGVLTFIAAAIGRALSHAAVIPITMPGAFFWLNKGFVEHARDVGLAEMPQLGVVHERRHPFRMDALWRSFLETSPREKWDQLRRSFTGRSPPHRPNSRSSGAGSPR